jgi:hypothetical protein
MQAKARIDGNGIMLLVLLAVFAFTFLNFKGTDDANNWLRWVAQTRESGLVGGYKSADMNYPPGAFVLLTVSARAGTVIGIPERVGIKLAIYFMLLLTIAIFLAYCKNAFLSALLGLSLILNSVDLAYIDIFFAPFLLLALWAIEKQKIALFAVAFMLAVLTKWQPLVLTPFFALYLLQINSLKEARSIPWKRILTGAVLPGAAVAGLTLAIFGLPLLKSLQQALSFPVLSAQALNANWILTYILNIIDPARYAPLINGAPNFIFESQGFISSLPRFLFWILFAIILALWFRAAKTFENLMLFSLLGYLAYFTFGVGAHENHLFVAVLLAAVLAHIRSDYWPVFVTWALAANINLFVFYGIDGRTLPFSRLVWGFDTSIALAAVNVILFVSYFVMVVRKTQGQIARRVSNG